MFEVGRGIGLTEALQEVVGLPTVVLFALITQLGDIWFLFLLGGALYVSGDEFPYWRIDRRRGLFVLALVLMYVSLIGVLKNVFLLPRPPGAGDPPVVQGIPSILQVIFTTLRPRTGRGSRAAMRSGARWSGVASR